jgi:hypothetical protein
MKLERGLVGLGSALLAVGVVLIVGQATGCQTIQALTQPGCQQFAKDLQAERTAAGWQLAQLEDVSPTAFAAVYLKGVRVDAWVYRADGAPPAPTDDALTAAGFVLETQCSADGDGVTAGSYWRHPVMTLPRT